jgi:glycosyltransferase involved in cell wall biosynthesis
MALRVLLLVNSLGMGGAERHTLQVAGALADRGADVVVDSLRGGSHYEISDPRIKLRSTGGNGLVDLSALWRLARFIDAYKPDIVVGVSDRPLYYARLARALSIAQSFSLVAIRHGTGFARPRDRLLAPLNRYIVNQCDLVIYVSRLQRDWWVSRGHLGKKSFVILNAVDCSYFAVPSEEQRAARRVALGIGADELVLGLCAALRPEKNVGQLIEATALLNATGVLARAIIVGDGPQAQSLRSAAAARGIDARVLFAGAQKDIRPWIAAFDVGVLCSTTIETMSLAALEIMASGRPMILSEIGGAAEIVRPGVNGFLFKAGELTELVASAKKFRDPTLVRQMGANARLIVESEFSLSRMCDQYWEVLSSMNALRAE